MAPQEIGNLPLGEIFLEEPEMAKNKQIKLNMLSVTGDMRKQNTNLNFLIDKIEGSQAHTKIVGYEIPPAHIKRMAKKARTKVDDSFVCKTLDSKIRVKPVIILRGQAPNSVQTAIRKASQAGISQRAKGVETVKFFQQVMRMDIQKQMKSELKKIYPLNNYTIRMMKVE